MNVISHLVKIELPEAFASFAHVLHIHLSRNKLTGRCIRQRQGRNKTRQLLDSYDPNNVMMILLQFGWKVFSRLLWQAGELAVAAMSKHDQVFWNNLAVAGTACTVRTYSVAVATRW